MDATLLLNASFEPIKVISWQRAVTLFFLGKVEVVEEYNDREVRSVSLALKMPAVVRLLRYVHPMKRRLPLTRLHILARDNFQCQYCGHHIAYRESTLDHVFPRSRGGDHRWENLVAACHHCNRKKGGRTPEEARMKLLNVPVEPDWLPFLVITLSRQIHPSWELFLTGK